MPDEKLMRRIEALEGLLREAREFVGAFQEDFGGDHLVERIDAALTPSGGDGGAKPVEPWRTALELACDEIMARADPGEDTESASLVVTTLWRMADPSVLRGTPLTDAECDALEGALNEAAKAEPARAASEGGEEEA